MRARTVLAFVAGYGSAVLAAWLVFVIEGVLLYGGLLVAAVAFDRDTGGPLAGLLLVALAAVLGIVVTALVCVPAAALGHLAGRRARRWQWTKTLAATLGSAALLLALYIPGAVLIASGSGTGALVAWTVALAVTAPPTIVFTTVGHGSRRLFGWLERRQGGAAEVAAAG
ncbi:hypothetical protein [Virgisporangium aurantiacum]|uniref:Uncharacterized protein n=1 Tax=Virgisporangium aurantiacum TaxID=175570 RepID=A0A8J3ZC98_9ACTN|nr:hypothetical protein [Virgisporangium aurantiacum]GIJ61321.1 hypothetical protein Vau01_088370 [Virgisporangium aurantiacum]